MTWVRLAPGGGGGSGSGAGLRVLAGPWDGALAAELVAAVHAGATVLAVPDETPPTETARLAALAEPAGAAVLLATSGSTGAARLVARPLRSLADEGLRYVRGGWVGATDRVLVAVSPAHAYALGWVFACAAAGAEVAVVPPRAFGAVEAALADGATVLVTTPPLARLLRRRVALSGAAAPALRLAMAGAGPVDAALDAAWRETFGQGLARNYGSTETGAVLAGPAGLPPGCVGTALPGVRVEVLTSAVCVVLEDGSVHELPDLAETDAAGNVTIVGRAGDARARAGGRWVAPRDVEAAARDVPGVVDALVTVTRRGDDDALTVDYVAAGGPVLDPDELRARLRAVTATPCAARRVRRIRRTAAGKVAAPRDLVPRADLPPGSVAAVLRDAVAAVSGGEVAGDLADLALLAGALVPPGGPAPEPRTDPSPCDLATLVAAARRGYGATAAGPDGALAAAARAHPGAVAGAVHGAAADLCALGDDVVVVDRFLDAAGCDTVATALRWVAAGLGDWWTLDALGAGLTAAGVVVTSVAECGDGIAVVTGTRA